MELAAFGSFVKASYQNARKEILQQSSTFDASEVKMTEDEIIKDIISNLPILEVRELVLIIRSTCDELERRKLFSA